MQKIYLLLRNNKQSGPHSLEELIQLELKNTDLVWVEGRSMGWSFPSEVEALKSFLPREEKPSINQDTSSKTEKVTGAVFVSLPQGTANSSLSAEESRAAEARNRAVNYAPSIEDEIQNNYSRSLYEVENDYTSWVVKNHKRKNKLPGKKIAIACIVIAGSIGGWLLAGMAYDNTKGLKTKLNQVAAQHSPVLAISENSEVAQVEETQITPIAKPEKKTVPKKQNRNKGNETDNKMPEVISPAQMPVLVKGKQEEAKEDQPPAEEETEKKPSLKEKIGNWLKGGKEIGSANAKKEKVITDITSEVDVRIAGEPDNWMMGIKGRKIIVTNKSNLNLTTAIIEVMYYSEENNLIETKKIQSGNLSSGKSKAVAVPDHKMADHFEIRLESAFGE